MSNPEQPRPLSAPSNFSPDRIILAPDREESLRKGHPWIFSGAVAKVEGNPVSGGTVEVYSFRSEWLARAFLSPSSQIRARIWTWNQVECINEDFFRNRIRNALRRRTTVFPVFDPMSALRLIHSEADGLPGLTVDRYGNFLICQFLSAGVEHHKAEVVQILAEETNCSGIYERSDTTSREKEGLPNATGVLYGEEPPEWISITENNSTFRVDVRRGHKTGFYLDQRDNRALAARYAEGREVLNCFSYTGGFAIPALLNRAKHVVNIDSSGESLTLCQWNLEANRINPEQYTLMEGDVFQELRRFRDARREFDMIILDPPKFAEAKRKLDRAVRGYKDINIFGCKLLRPGGILFTFSCSGQIDLDLFRKIVAGAARDAGREPRILHFLHQAPDHPVALSFPESEYLKGLACILD